MDKEIEKAEELYRTKFQAEIEPAYKGKYIAIDTSSEDYFMGDEILEAYQKAAQKYPDKTFVFKRIGFPAARCIGSR